MFQNKQFWHEVTRCSFLTEHWHHLPPCFNSTIWLPVICITRLLLRSIMMCLPDVSKIFETSGRRSTLISKQVISSLNFFSSHTNNMFPSILVALSTEPKVKVCIRRLVVAYVCSFVSQILVGLNFPNNGTSVNWSRASGTLLTSRNGSKLCSQPWQWPTIRTLATSWHHYLPTQSRLVNVFWCLSINLLSSPMKEISLFNSFVQIGNMYEKLHEVVWERVWEKSFFLVFFWENYILNWM